MYCRSCGKELENNALFCPFCGAKTETMIVALTQAKCTNCGAPLQVDPSKATALCPFCQHEYIVQQAIQNYAISVMNAQMHIQNANVHVNSGQDFDSLVKNGRDCDSVGRIREAINYYKRALDYRPMDSFLISRLHLLQNASYYSTKYAGGRWLELHLDALISRTASGEFLYAIPLNQIWSCEYVKGVFSEKCVVTQVGVQAPYEYKVADAQQLTYAIQAAMVGYYPALDM